MRRVNTIISILSLIALPLLAQDEKKPSTTNQVQLSEVTVTSSRIATPIAQTPKSVTIITKEEIAKAQVSSILDLLEYAANIDVQQRSPHGAQADISLRGGNFNQTAVLVDGVNLSNAQTGHYSFDIPVNISDIERIEVVHGPSALIYGSSAFSGGVNIITKKEVSEKAYANVASGMHNLKYLEARGALKTGIASHSLSVSQSESDGYIKNTDYNIYNLLWQSRFKFKNSNKLDVQLGYNDKHYGANSFYTAAFPNQYEYTSSYSATAKGEFGTKLKFIPIVYWTRHTDQFDLIKDSVYGRNYHRGDTYGTNLIFQYKSKLGTTNLGGEIRKEDMLSSKLGNLMEKPHGKYTSYIDRVNTSATLEHSVTIDKVSLEAGGLFNHNSFAGGTSGFYPSASVTYNPSGSLKIASSWSKSVRMPTYTELFYNTATHVANENLLPEKSESTELLFRYRHSFVELNVTGFLLWGRNIIDWIKETPSSKSTATNLTKVNTQGVEGNLRLRLTSLTSVFGENASLALGYTRMWQDYDAQNYISESQNKLNYLRDKFTGQFTHRIYKELSASWYFRLQKRMGTYTDYENNVSTEKQVGYPGFSTLDLKLDYRLENLRFNLSLSNLYNTKYVYLGNIEQPGFWLTGGISYVFK